MIPASLSDFSGDPSFDVVAVGADMHSVMGGNYPGPGITIGPAIVFAYLTARDIVRRLQQPNTREQGAPGASAHV